MKLLEGLSFRWLAARRFAYDYEWTIPLVSLDKKGELQLVWLALAQTDIEQYFSVIAHIIPAAQSEEFLKSVTRRQRVLTTYAHTREGVEYILYIVGEFHPAYVGN